MSTLSSTIQKKNFTNSNSIKKNYENTTVGAYSNFTNNFQLLQDMEFASGKKDDNNFKNINIGTPAFYLENSGASSRKNNKSSSNKKVELRYIEENELNNKINNISFKNFSYGNIYENSNLNLSAYSKNYLNTEYNNKERSNSCINQKLNFEIINENYQNGIYFNNLII